MPPSTRTAAAKASRFPQGAPATAGSSASSRANDPPGHPARQNHPNQTRIVEDSDGNHEEKAEEDPPRKDRPQRHVDHSGLRHARRRGPMEAPIDGRVILVAEVGLRQNLMGLVEVLELLFGQSLSSQRK